MQPRRVLKLDSPAPSVSDRRDRVPITLLGRRGCHLCDDASLALSALADTLGIQVIETDVDHDAALRARFDVHVPVLLHGDTEICRHALDIPALERHLATLLRRDPSCRT
ncbi:MAG: glutaredoxin family protein [Pseudomonadota bacterium]